MVNSVLQRPVVLPAGQLAVKPTHSLRSSRGRRTRAGRPAKGEDKKLADAIRIGFIEGMLDFNESLRQLVGRGDVAEAGALEVAPNPDALKMA